MLQRIQSTYTKSRQSLRLLRLLLLQRVRNRRLILYKCVEEVRPWEDPEFDKLGGAKKSQDEVPDAGSRDRPPAALVHPFAINLPHPL